MIARLTSRFFQAATATRRTSTLLALAGLIALAYVLLTFDLNFLAGRGAFWKYPVGPWLLDAADLRNNVDVLDYLVGYTGLVHSPWTWPLTYVPSIGSPAGTSVVFLDVMPIVALSSRILSAITGVLIIPYGAWVGVCFILSGMLGALLLAEAGQKTLLAAIAGCLFAVSSPILLHRFAHLPLMAQFLIIGALYLYVREQRPLSRFSRALLWLGWLLVAAMTNPYMLAMVSAIYAASLARGWRQHGLRSRLIEPALIGVALVFSLVALGYIGSGSSLSGTGYGHFSMNLLSPFMPQRSGVLPSQQTIVDATDGQYEGFSYLGFGGLALLVWALVINPAGLRRGLVRHGELVLVLAAMTAFAVSNHAFIGNYNLYNLDIGWRLGRLAGIYRSSGRMFWPVYYAILFGSLSFALRHSSKRWQVGLITGCCILQLIDAEPLRARLTALTAHGVAPLIDLPTWSKRMEPARFLEVYPTFFCSDERQATIDMELQLTAVRLNRPFNVSYNPRLDPDCRSERRAALAGPWATDRLYVYLNGQNSLPPEFAPENLECNEFADGRWCLGPKTTPIR